MQSGNEIWSVNRVLDEKHFLKNHAQCMVEKLFSDPVLKSKN